MKKPLFKKISAKILIYFFVLTFFLVLVGTASYFYFSLDTLEKNTQNILLATAKTRANYIETYLNKQISALELAATHQDLSREELTKIKEINSDFDSLIILDPNGKLIVTSDLALADYSDADFLKNNTSGNKTFVSLHYYSPVLKRDTIVIATKQGTNILAARLKLEGLRKIVSDRTGLGETGEVILAVREGENIIYLTNRLFGDKAVPDVTSDINIAVPMKEALNGKEEYFKNSLDYRGVPVSAVSEYIEPWGIGLVAKIDRTEVLNSFQGRFFRLSLFTVFALIFIFIILARLISRRISKPIEQLQSDIKFIENGDLEHKISYDALDEIGGLAISFNQMVSGMKQSRSEIDKKVKEQTEELKTKSEDLQNQERAILNILEDVQKEKNKAEELAAIVRDTNESIVSVNMDGVIQSWNHGAELLYQYSESEVLGKSIKLVMPEEKVEDYDYLKKMILDSSSVTRYKTKRKRKDGSIFDAAVSVSPVKDYSGKMIGVSISTLDITKEQEIDKAKTEFVSLASHQLRTPLSAINWYTEMLLSGDAGKLNEDQEKYLKEVYSGNQRMVSLVNALLNVSRLDLGTFMIEPTPVDLKEMAKSVIGELENMIKAKNQNVIENYAENLPVFSADQNLMRIIFQNLLSNSVKYTQEKGEIVLNILVTKKDETFGGRAMRGDCLIISVSDNGMGIPVDQKDKIFSKLFRADNAKATETEGTGLGLYIIKSIVDKAGGEIWFESKEKSGTSFYVCFPISGMKKKEGTRKLD
jgi:PAS domain S-box-containing protein